MPDLLRRETHWLKESQSVQRGAVDLVARKGPSSFSQRFKVLLLLQKSMDVDCIGGRDLTEATAVPRRSVRKGTRVRSVHRIVTKRSLAIPWDWDEEEESDRHDEVARSSALLASARGGAEAGDNASSLLLELGSEPTYDEWGGLLEQAATPPPPASTMNSLHRALLAEIPDPVDPVEYAEWELRAFKSALREELTRLEQRALEHRESRSELDALAAEVERWDEHCAALEGKKRRLTETLRGRASQAERLDNAAAEYQWLDQQLLKMGTWPMLQVVSPEKPLHELCQTHAGNPAALLALLQECAERTEKLIRAMRQNRKMD